MILGYINSKPTTKIYKQKKIKIERYVNNFDFADIRFITERNRHQLIHTTKQNEPYLFITNTFEEIGKSPTDVAELIISILNLDIQFVIIQNDIYFNIDTKHIVYPTVFEYFRAKYSDK